MPREISSVQCFEEKFTALQSEIGDIITQSLQIIESERRNGAFPPSLATLEAKFMSTKNKWRDQRFQVELHWFPPS